LKQKKKLKLEEPQCTLRKILILPNPILNMNMKHFTTYARVHPNGTLQQRNQAAQAQRNQGQPRYQLTSGGFRKTIAMDKIHFKPGQKSRASAILEVLSIAKRQGIPVRNIDKLCKAAQRLYKKENPTGHPSREEFREAFATLISAEYIKRI